MTEKTAAVIVAHPDDETLWAGGFILMHPEFSWTIAALCRRSDPDRRPRFIRACRELGAMGYIGDMDDGPDQEPLSDQAIRNAVYSLLPAVRYDLVVTHNPFGEYYRHIRHEETGLAVLKLWEDDRIRTSHMWLFAYQDHERKRNPLPAENATMKLTLPETVMEQKRHIIGEIYGFEPDSWEYGVMPGTEAFWCFENPDGIQDWMMRRSFSDIAIS